MPNFPNKIVNNFFAVQQSGKRRAYWALVESVRTERGPRQKVVSWLGALDEAGRISVLQAAQNHQASVKPQLEFKQQSLFEYEVEAVEPHWVRVNAKAVRVENNRQFGGPWLALQLIQHLKLDEFLNKHLPKEKEQIQWSLSSMILVIARPLDPSSELYVSEQWYPKKAIWQIGSHLGNGSRHDLRRQPGVP